jgi:hypothetical protein
MRGTVVTGIMTFAIVYFVCLVHGVQDRNQTNQTNQTNEINPPACSIQPFFSFSWPGIKSRSTISPFMIWRSMISVTSASDPTQYQTPSG